MPTSNPVAQLTRARRHYIQAGINLCTAMRLLDTLHLPDKLKIAFTQALVDNRASIDYLNDTIRTLELAADSPPVPERRSVTHAGA